MIKVLRLYMGADAETVALATGMSTTHYTDIENGYAEPTEAEYQKLSAVFGLDEDYITGKREIPESFIVRQPMEDSVFVTEELREKMKLCMTDLSPDEKKLILLIRSADDSAGLMEKVTNIVCDEVF